MIEGAVKGGVKQFIFASSASVYGVKKEKDVTEELSLVPISTYNKTKMISERVLRSLVSFGLPSKKVALSAKTSGDVVVPEVHIYVQ